jgi:hypothetical protein
MSENSFYENRKKVFDELRKDVVLNQETTSWKPRIIQTETPKEL